MATGDQHLIRFQGTLDGFEIAFAELRGLLDARAIPAAPRYNVEVAFEEIAMNIIRHGSPTADVEVAVTFSDDEVVLRFMDDGIPFDPRQHPDPVAPTSIETATIGGLGLMLVRKISRRFEYERGAGHNHLTVALPAR